MAIRTPPRNTSKKRQGWRIPISMPKDWKAAAELRERLGPRAAHRSLAEWPTPSEAEQEQLKRDFKEATPGELRAFRLRHGILRDWTILKVWSNWEVRSPRMDRLRPTPYSRQVQLIRLYSLDQLWFDELHSEVMEYPRSEQSRALGRSLGHE